MPREANAWQRRSNRLLTWMRRIDLVVLGAGLAAGLRWGKLAILGAFVVLALMRLAIWSTGVLRCPHCDGSLWGLSDRIIRVRFCPFCGRELVD